MALLAIADAALFADPSAAQPQRLRTFRVGFVSLASPGPLLGAFLDGLRDAGYVEGSNVVVVSRSADGREERLADLIADVVRQQVDVLVVISTRTAIVAKQASAKIPIVFASVFDPVAAGLVGNLARPGRNVTGVAVGVGGGFGGKWVEILQEVVPGMARAAVLWNSTNPSSRRSVDEIRAAAMAAKVKLDVFDAGSARNLDKAFAAIDAAPPDGMIVAPDPFFGVNRKSVIEFAARKRLPAMYFFKSYVDEGGLMSYGASNEESARMAAKYVDKILRGAAPGDLPVEQPTRFELAVNLKTARALGLTIPKSVLVRADHLVQ